MTTPTLSLLQGLWTGSYSSFILLVSPPISPPAKTNPIPKVGSDYTPSVAIITIVFDGNGNHSGRVLVNFAGTLAHPRVFSGTYDVVPDASMGTVEGRIRLNLTTDPIGSSQTSILHYVMKSHQEMVFMVEEAQVATSATTTGTTAGGSLAQGTLTRVLPMGLSRE
jgi:hypothetical protein